MSVNGSEVPGSHGVLARRGAALRPLHVWVTIVALLALVGLAPACDAEARGRQAVVGAWAASPQTPDVGGVSRTGFADQTLRLVVHTSAAGDAVRLRLSNAFGTQPVTFGPVRVGIRAGGASIWRGTSRAVTFGRVPSVTIPAGEEARSDPVDLTVAAGEDIAVSLYAPSATGPATWHAMAMTTSYEASGDQTGDDQGAAFTKTTGSWFFLTGIDVVSREARGTIVALGDSITDGWMSSFDADHRWTDYLAQRLETAPPAERKSIVNEGISGNEILKDRACCGSQVSALARLDRDVLAQAGATDVILLEGINDIGAESASTDDVIGGMRQIIARVHARGLEIHGGTLTPIGGSVYDSPQHEAAREAVNQWIRTSGEFDGVIDFDRAIRDPTDPERILPGYDSGDHIHPVDAGFEAMAAAVDLRQFSR